jgi:hypothetical protein
LAGEPGLKNFHNQENEDGRSGVATGNDPGTRASPLILLKGK